MTYGILDSAEITQELAAMARTIGLDESEIESTIASGLKAGGRYPRRLPFLKSNDRLKSVEPPVKSNDELAANSAARSDRYATMASGLFIGSGQGNQHSRPADGLSTMANVGFATIFFA